MTDDFARHLDICLGLRAYSHPATIRNPPSNFQPSVVGQNGADTCVLHTLCNFQPASSNTAAWSHPRCCLYETLCKCIQDVWQYFPSCFAMNIWMPPSIPSHLRQIPSCPQLSRHELRGWHGKTLGSNQGGVFVRVADQLDLKISLNQPEKKASCHPKWRKHVQVPCFTFRELWW